MPRLHLRFPPPARIAASRRTSLWTIVLKANPNGRKTSHSGKLLAQGAHVRDTNLSKTGAFTQNVLAQLAQQYRPRCCSHVTPYALARSEWISRIGGLPKKRLYSRLNWLGLSYPTSKAALAASSSL